MDCASDNTFLTPNVHKRLHKYGETKTLEHSNDSIFYFLAQLTASSMASSQRVPKAEGSSHRWNIFKHKNTKQALPVQNGEISASIPINAVYYPNWRVYRQQPPSSMNLDFITHIFYAFAW